MRSERWPKYIHDTMSELAIYRFSDAVNLRVSKSSLIGGINMFSIWRRDALQTAPIASEADILRELAME